MAAGKHCPGRCLFSLISGIPVSAPPKNSKDCSSDREQWLEVEVSRLQREAWRLGEHNEELRSELRYRQRSPARAQKRYSMALRDVARIGADERMEEGADGGDGTNTSTREKFAADVAALADSGRRGSELYETVAGKVNQVILRGSARAMTKPVQALIYILAFGGVVFVLVATAVRLGANGAGSCGGADGHAPRGPTYGTDCETGFLRRLGWATSPLMRIIAVTFTCAGMFSLVVHKVRQPLIIGYILAGVIVGPHVLGIVDSHLQIADLSSLGLVFLLFMIGLELDIKHVGNLDRVATITGALQFPICAGFMALLFSGLAAAGVPFGAGRYSPVYIGVTAALSSQTIVAKLLADKCESDSPVGRMTSAILLFQNLWALLLLALQNDLGRPTILGFLQTFGATGGLILVALAYAKFVLPAALYTASTSVELMLVLAVSWCFFVCATAILPFVGLPMELAGMVAGMALATFPYSADFHSKIKYIRDFFFTLFFSSVGMMLPVPNFGDILTSGLVTLTVLVVRWLGVFSIIKALGGGTRVGVLTTLNLSQIGELALVLMGIGVTKEHCSSRALNVLLLAFLMLAVASYYLIGYNDAFHRKCLALYCAIRGRPHKQNAVAAQEEEEDREIVLLGFNKVAFMLVAEIKAKTPELLQRLQVIDFNKKIMPKLRELGIKCTYGDIGDPDALANATEGEPRIAISTIPDELLQGVTNARIIRHVHSVWPTTHIIVTADNPKHAKQLYDAGADYVLGMAKLSAERLHDILQDGGFTTFDTGNLQEMFSGLRESERDDKDAEFLKPTML